MDVCRASSGTRFSIMGVLTQQLVEDEALALELLWPLTRTGGLYRNASGIDVTMPPGHICLWSNFL